MFPHEWAVRNGKMKKDRVLAPFGMFLEDFCNWQCCDREQWKDDQSREFRQDSRGCDVDRMRAVAQLIRKELCVPLKASA